MAFNKIFKIICLFDIVQCMVYLPEFKKFNDFLTNYNKSYFLDETIEKYLIFQNNSLEIYKHNSDELNNYQLGINYLLDYPPNEYRKLLGYNSKKKYTTENCDFNIVNIPDSIDWRQQNAVTSVKKQGQCGSCWSFSTIGAIEGAYAIKYHKLINFSEQQLIDCDQENHGCEGGDMELAFDYLENHYICPLSDYKYRAEDDQCLYQEGCSDGPELNGYCQVAINNEQELKKAVAQQPVSVAIEADNLHFQLYSSGIFNYKKCGNNLDHGVLVVGYGTENNQDYWIIKNSWGSNWGENGYIRIARNTNLDGGLCGISLEPSIPFIY